MIEFWFSVMMFVLFASAAPLWVAAGCAVAVFLMARAWGRDGGS